MPASKADRSRVATAQKVRFMQQALERAYKKAEAEERARRRAEAMAGSAAARARAATSPKGAGRAYATAMYWAKKARGAPKRPKG